MRTRPDPKALCRIYISPNRTVREDKEQLRKDIEADTRRFLNAGNSITHVEAGETGNRTQLRLTERQRDRANLVYGQFGEKRSNGN